MGFRVTKEEREQILERMESIGFTSVRAYLLKMAMNGYIVRLELDGVKECNAMIRRVGTGVNQILKRFHTAGHVTQDDINDIKASLDEVWKQQEKVIQSMAKVMEVI